MSNWSFLFFLVLGIGAYFLLSPNESYRRTEDGRILVDYEFLKGAKYSYFLQFLDTIFSFAKFDLDKVSLQRDAINRCGPGTFWQHPYGSQALEALTEAIRIDNPPLTNLGRFMLHENFVNWLCVQLKVEEILKATPSVRSERISSVIIAGAPRTGSTHLLSMLCRHPNATCLTFAESLDPLSTVRSEHILSIFDPRFYKSFFAVQAVLSLRPLFKYMFKFSATTPMEEIQLGAAVFGSTIFLTEIHLPTYNEWFKRTDHTPMEEYVKLLLKIIQTQRGGERKMWVLKSPQNSNQLLPKFKLYPNASIILTHRKTNEVIKSVLGMTCYTLGTFNYVDQVDYPSFAKMWVEQLKWSQVDRLIEHVEQIPKEKILDVEFQKYMENPIQTAMSAAKHAGLPVNLEIEKIFASFQKESPQEGSKKLKYGDFGYDDQTLNKMFYDYERRFLSPN